MFPFTRLGQRSARGLALLAVGGLLLAGCGSGDGSSEQAQNDQTQNQQTAGDGSGGQGSGGSGDLPDPSQNVEDGVYRGNGVVLPVPEGWSVDPAGVQQGIVAATSDDGQQQLTARAINAAPGATPGGSAPVDTLVQSMRGQIDQEPATDEAVDLAGAEQAYRLTYRDLPSQQGGQGATSQTIVVATDGDSALGQFTYSAPADAYDEELAARLVEEAGFDPDSEPPQLPQQQSAPQGGQSGSGSSSASGQGGG